MVDEGVLQHALWKGGIEMHSTSARLLGLNVPEGRDDAALWFLKHNHMPRIGWRVTHILLDHEEGREALKQQLMSLTFTWM